jgi:hypothetical protein
MLLSFVQQQKHPDRDPRLRDAKSNMFTIKIEICALSAKKIFVSKYIYIFVWLNNHTVFFATSPPITLSPANLSKGHLVSEPPHLDLEAARLQNLAVDQIQIQIKNLAVDQIQIPNTNTNPKPGG